MYEIAIQTSDGWKVVNSLPNTEPFGVVCAAAEETHIQWRRRVQLREAGSTILLIDDELNRVPS